MNDLKKRIELLVEAAMVEAWSDICSESGSHPLDIERVGRKTFFKPRHWAERVGKHVAHAIVTDAGFSTGLPDELNGTAQAVTEAIFSLGLQQRVLDYMAGRRADQDGPVAADYQKFVEALY